MVVIIISFGALETAHGVEVASETPPKADIREKILTPWTRMKILFPSGINGAWECASCRKVVILACLMCVQSLVKIRAPEA